MKDLPTILQIVPKPPGRWDGVADYALGVAQKLLEKHGYNTVFATDRTASTDGINGFKIISPLTFATRDHPRKKEFDHVILHYVNYGYQKRGVPISLLPILRALRRNCRGRLLTVFHELYASGPPWKSAFWLRPLQVHIARSIAHISDGGVVSSEIMLAQLQRLRPGIRALVHPVPSNFGEPQLSLDQLSKRSPHRWVICGGTVLVERSLRSLCRILDKIPPFFWPHELIVLGGSDNPAVRSLVASLAGVRTDYHPNITAAEASDILSNCSFGWIDYFHRSDVPVAAILKSTAFAALCAHGVIAVFPHRGSSISVDGNRFPGPYFISGGQQELPSVDDRARVASQIYDWYQRCASSAHLGSGIARLLDLPSSGNEV